MNSTERLTASGSEFQGKEQLRRACNRNDGFDGRLASVILSG